MTLNQTIESDSQSVEDRFSRLEARIAKLEAEKEEVITMLGVFREAIGRASLSIDDACDASTLFKERQK